MPFSTSSGYDSMEIGTITGSISVSAFLQERQEKYRLESSGDPPDSPWDDADELRWAVRHWAARLSVPVPQIHVRPMTTKWASISTRGRLTLNADLIDLPRALGEYVVLHELLHLLVPNHGRLFKLFLDAYMADWREREGALNSTTS
jgi:hypothetical protein